MLSGLEVRLLNYFLLIIFAAAVIGLEFYFEISQPELGHALCTDQAAETTPGSLAQHTDPLIHLRNKIVLMFAVLTLVVAIVLMMFIKNITLPLQSMITMAQEINEGNLDYSIDIETRDEIGQLGVAMNELRNNVQEISAFTSTTSQAISTQLAELGGASEQPVLTREKIDKIQDHLKMLTEFVDSFRTSQAT